MLKIRNIAVAIIVVATFVIASVLCSSMYISGQHPSAAKFSCCPSKSSSSSSDSCGSCPIALKSVDFSKIFVLAPVFVVGGHGFTFESFTFKPVQVFLKPVFSNDPPGPLRIVPLYTQFHSLRI